MALFFSILKFLPEIIVFIKQLNALAEKQVMNYKLTKIDDKIEMIFESDKTPQQKAKELDEIFIGKIK